MVKKKICKILIFLFLFTIFNGIQTQSYAYPSDNAARLIDGVEHNNTWKELGTKHPEMLIPLGIAMPRKYTAQFVEKKPGGQNIFQIEVREMGGKAYGDWVVRLKNHDVEKYWECTVVDVEETTINRGLEYGYKITARIPEDLPPEVFDLEVTAPGSQSPYLSESSVRCVEDFDEKFYIMHTSDQHVKIPKDDELDDWHAYTADGCSNGKGLSGEGLSWSCEVYNLINPRFIAFTGDNVEGNTPTFPTPFPDNQDNWDKIMWERMSGFYNAYKTSFADANVPGLMCLGDNDSNEGGKNFHTRKALLFEKEIGYRAYIARMGDFSAGTHDHIDYETKEWWLGQDQYAGQNQYKALRESSNFLLFLQHYFKITGSTGRAITHEEFTSNGTAPPDLVLVGHNAWGAMAVERESGAPPYVAVMANSQAYNKSGFVGFEKVNGNWICKNATPETYGEGENIFRLTGNNGIDNSLSVVYSSPNDKNNPTTENSMTVTVTNKLPINFYDGRVKLYLSSGTYKVTEGEDSAAILAQYDYDDGKRAVVLKVDIPPAGNNSYTAPSTISFTVSKENEPEPTPSEDAVNINMISDKFPGDEVSINGETLFDEVSIKILYPNGSIYNIESVRSEQGYFNHTFILSDEAPPGVYTVVAGRGNTVAVTTFKVLDPDITPEISIDAIEDKYPGDEVTVSGETTLSEVDITVAYPNAEIYMSTTVEVIDGNYSYTFTLGEDIPYGIYTVTAGKGEVVASTTFEVLEPTIPEPDEISIDAISDKYPGDEVTVSGETTLSEVDITVAYPNAEIYKSATVEVIDGNYSYTFTLGEDIPYGDYTVTAGKGEVVASTTFEVLEPTIPEPDEISIDAISDKYPGGEVTVSGETTLSEVDITVAYPNSEIYKSTTVEVIDGNYSYTFTLGEDIPYGDYTVTAGKGEVVASTTFKVLEPTIPEPDEISIDAISDKYPGDEVTVSGETTFNEVSIKILYPHGGIYNIETVAVENGAYSYTFKLAAELPYGIYTVVVGRNETVASTTFEVLEPTIPEPDEISIDAISDKYPGDEVTVSGETTLSEVDITVAYPNAEIYKSTTVEVIDGNYSYTFTLGEDIPYGIYTVTAGKGEVVASTTFEVLEPTIPEPDEISIDAISDKYPGDEVTVSGETTLSEVDIMVAYPNAEIYKSTTVEVIDGNYSYTFTLGEDIPYGDYTVTAGKGEVVASTTFKVLEPTIPEPDEISIDAISDKYPGDEVTVSGETTFNEVSIKILYPHGGIYNIETVSVENGAYAYTFRLAAEIPYGIYTVVVGRNETVASTTFKVLEPTIPEPDEISIDAISDKYPGDEVTVSGETTLSEVDITVAYPNAEIYKSATVEVIDGNYSYTFTLGEDIPYGIYTVTAGKGDVVASTTFNVIKREIPISPTPKPEPEEEDKGSPAGPVATPTPIPSPAPIIKSNEDGSVTVEMVKPKADSDGIAKTILDDKTLNSALEKTKADAGEMKKVEIVIPEAEGADSYRLQLPAGFISEKEASCEYEIRTAIGNITIPSDMLKDKGDNVELTITKVDNDTLPEEVRSAIGDKPVIQLSISIDGKEISWNNPDAPVKVSIPYTPAKDEDPEKITIWYIDGDGNIIPVYNGRYDEETGMVTFTVTHFSLYAVAYVNVKFEDTKDYPWAERAIEVLASKGIIKGTSTTRLIYSPSSNITRADYIALLVRTLGLKAEVDSNFADVTTDDYFYEEVGIAKKLGITNGVGNNRFAPRAEITRQEMMTMTARALIALGKIDTPADKAIISRFDDGANVAEYARESVAVLVQEGLIVGTNGGKSLTPEGKTTRAEMAVLMYRIYNK